MTALNHWLKKKEKKRIISKYQKHVLGKELTFVSLFSSRWVNLYLYLLISFVGGQPAMSRKLIMFSPRWNIDLTAVQKPASPWFSTIMAYPDALDLKQKYT